jgi:CRP-like cAMP-binding protein
MRTYRRKAKIAPSEELHRIYDAIEPIYKWTTLKFLISWLNCLIAPIIIGILQDVPIWNELSLVGFCCDMIKIIELIAHLLPWFLDKYINTNTTLETQRPSLGQSKLYICANVASVCPLVVVPIARACGVTGMPLAWICVARMLQVGDVVTIFQSLKLSLPRDSVFRNGTVSRVALVFVMTSIHASMLACAWFLISCPQRQNCPASNAWVSEDQVLNENSMFSDYIRSLHFVVQTLFTVGYGDIAPYSNGEIIFALFLVLNGSLFYGFLISSITSLISNKDISTKLFRSDMATLRQLLSMRDVPLELSTRVDGLFSFLFTRQSGLLESKFMDDIPAPLIRDIKRSFLPQLTAIPFFAHQSTRLVRHVVDRMLMRSYVPKSIVFFQNERRRELFVIRSGKLDIKVRSSLNVLFSYMAGEYVGDFQLIFGTPSEVTVESGAYTEVLVLTFEALVDAISSSGEVAKGQDFEKWLACQQPSLEATVTYHKQLLLRVIKVRTSMEEIKKKNKFAEMMADVPTGNITSIIFI